MTKCRFCGSPMLEGQNTCGLPKCMKQAESLNAEREGRTARHQMLMSYIPEMLLREVEGHERALRTAQSFRRRIYRQLEHEGLQRMYARMRDEGDPHEGE